MKRLATILAITIGTVLFMMLIAVPAGAKTVTKVRPVVGANGPVTVDVWTDRAEGSVYNPGESIAVYFHASADCYVTIYDIDTDGRVNILFPEYPDDGYVFGGMTYRLPEYYRNGSLTVTGSRGIEYIQAVATHTPGAFRYQNYGGRYRLGIDPIVGDPFEAMNSINGRIIRHGHISATATTWFFVGGRVWYPRYMCNSCHGGNYAFDPYIDACPRYSVHVAGGYDYWWNHSYYPRTSVHFSFGGPFWRFELRTIPVYRNRHIRYIDVAYGYHNYYTPRPPRRPFRHIPMTTSRTYVRRDRVQNYQPVSYKEVRERRTRSDNGRTVSGSTLSGRTDPRTRDYTTSSSRTERTGTTTTTRTTTTQTRTPQRIETSTQTRTRQSSAVRDDGLTSSSRERTGEGWDGRSTSTRTRVYYDGSESSNRATTAPSTSPRSTETNRTRSAAQTRTNEGTRGAPQTRSDERTRSSYDDGSSSRSARTVAPPPNSQSVPDRTPRQTETRHQTRSRTLDIQTSRIPSAPKSEAAPSRSASSSRSPGSETRSRQQSSSSSSSRSSTRTR